MDPQSEGQTSDVLADEVSRSPGPSVYDPAGSATSVTALPVPRQPIAAGASTGVGSSRGRWLVGGAVAVAAVAALVLAAVLVGARPLPDVLKYVPAGSAVVVELHPELPGDQRGHLGNFLAHFPGFADQSILDQKIDEVLERIVSEGTDGSVDYGTRVEPLLAGPLAISVSREAMADAVSGGSASGILAVATTDGLATCDSVFGPSTVVESYRDVEIRGLPESRSVACAVHNSRYLLVGSVPAIRDGLDARLDNTGVDGNSTYVSARAKLQGDQVASVFLDMDPFLDAIRGMAGSMGQEINGLPSSAWVIGGLRVTDDALVVEAYAPAADSPTLPGAPTPAPVSESRFAGHLPADTLAYMEFHGVGASIEGAIAGLRADPAQAEVVQGLDDALLALGGTANLVDWIEELGVAVLPTDDSVGGAVLIRGTDAETAASRVTQIRNLLVVASVGSDITITDTDHDGVTVTTVDLGDISSLLGDVEMFGAPIPGGGTGAPVEFSFAARDDLVVIGVGAGIVERILDVEAGASLATSATYGHVIEIAGTRNNAQVYVAIDASLALAERFLPDDQLSTWNRELKPYLDHLAGLAMTVMASNGAGHVRVVLTVK